MIIGRTADAATLFDTDGISVRFMNGPVEGNNIKSAAEANNLLQQVSIGLSCLTQILCPSQLPPVEHIACVEISAALACLP